MCKHTVVVALFVGPTVQRARVVGATTHNGLAKLVAKALLAEDEHNATTEHPVFRRLHAGRHDVLQMIVDGKEPTWPATSPPMPRTRRSVAG